MNKLSIALVSVIIITIAVVAIDYYWLTEVQPSMQAGSSVYQAVLTGQVTKEIEDKSVADVEHDQQTKREPVSISSISRSGSSSKTSRTTRIVTEESCTASDDGLNYEVKGTCDDKSGSNTDYCWDTNKLAEYYCYSESCLITLYDCQYGCLDGICLEEVSENNWTQKFPASKPSARWYHAIVTIYNDDKVVMFGGFDGGYDDETWVYDLSDNTWTQKFPASKPSGRYGHAMATVDGTDNVVLFGGYLGGGKYSSDTWVYDLSDDDWTLKSPASKPSGRYTHAMATVDGTDNVVLFGGYNGTEIGETWVYDSSDDDWTLKSPASKPSDREYPAMATVYNDDKIVLFGGLKVDNYHFNDTWVYDLSDNTWIQKNPANRPSGRFDHAMATVYNDDKIVLFGGDLNPNVHSDETWVYDLSDDAWTQKFPASKPSARELSAMAAVDGTDNVVLFGGQESGDLKNDETWIYA